MQLTIFHNHWIPGTEALTPPSAFSSSPKKHLEPSDKIQASASVGWGIDEEGGVDIS